MEKDDIRYAEIIVKTFDMSGVRMRSGGQRLAGRLVLVKKGVHDNTILMPNNHQVICDDLKDGTYAVRVSVKVSCNVKLVIRNVDKDLPRGAVELKPITLGFQKR